MMKIRKACEYGRIDLASEDLKKNGVIRMRQDVIRRGYVEWRSFVDKDTFKDDPREVDVDRALYAKGVVGLVPLAQDLAVMVEPRFPASVTHMVNVCNWPTVALNVLRYYDDSYQGVAADWMLDRIAIDFLDAVGRVLNQGIMRNYAISTEENSSPRGRINISRTMHRLSSRGVNYKVDYSYFERTEDNPSNQCLLEALHWTRSWFENRPEPMLKQMNLIGKYLHVLRNVPRDRDRYFLSNAFVRGERAMPPSRSEYVHAISLAVALIERRGFSLDGQEGTMGLTSLLLATDDLFEEFVRRRLRDYLEDSKLAVLDGNSLNPVRRLFERTHLPEGLSDRAKHLPIGSNEIQPDILVEKSGRTCLVVDVKYQQVRGHAQRSALDQCITYGVRLGCKNVMSVHPCASGSEDSGLFLSGKVGDINVWQYRINLGHDVDSEMRKMAEQIQILIKAGDEE